MSFPKIIDNDRKSLFEVFTSVAADYKDLSIATGYWDLEGMRSILPHIRSYEKIRLLIGREPLIPRHQLSKPEVDYPDQDFKFDLSMIAPESDLKDVVTEIKELIRQGKLEVRVYRKNFLHAKCYIFGSYDSEQAIGIIGSSNFTRNGLTLNTELNALESDHRVVAFQPKTDQQEVGHLYWFDRFWNDESTEDWNGEFTALLETSPVGDLLYGPYETYIKTLYELYKEEIEDDPGELVTNPNGRVLFDFQHKNVRALLRRLRKYRVAMLSDSVGLGKTTTAIDVLRQYLDDSNGKRRVEVICPKSLVYQWEKELTSEGIFGLKPITLQNMGEIERKRGLDAIAGVSLFVIDESHNLRQTTGTRFKQLLEWIRSNPKAHVLMLTATPINNQLSDITNQILLGTGGNAEALKVTIADDRKQTVQISFYQAVENLKKKINQDIKRNGKVDYDHIRQVMTPIIRTFVVRRTRQGIEQEYGSLCIDGKETKFPKVLPEVVEYEFGNGLVSSIRAIGSETVPVGDLYALDPEEIVERCKDLKHPLDQVGKVKSSVDEQTLNEESPMYFVFQLILMLGFMPYRWMMYQTKFYGKTREEVREIGLNSEDSKKLLLQLGLFGILRTVFLKRMESSVSALASSLGSYSRKLDLFEKGILEGKIVSFDDIDALEASLGDEDLDVDEELLEKNSVDDIDGKNYELDILKNDILREKELVSVIRQQLDIMGGDDSKIKAFVSLLEKLDREQPGRKVLVFSYFADTVEYLRSTIGRYSDRITEENTGFVSSKNRSDAETLASRFSPESKKYALKEDETDLRYLFSTDVLSEGQNLQDSNILINYDLHWNPVRMIQRNGRVNRLGSRFDEVFIYNMRPETKLDSYLRLIQRLQGKIDIIKNTIGTDTPVLDEPENPIEYTDSVSDIYSADFRKRMEALEKAEKASDYLLSEDQFVLDLKKFDADERYPESYKKSIYDISRGKWAITPKGDARDGKRPAVFGLTALFSETDQPAGFQFVRSDESGASLQAVSQLQALEWLRTEPEDNVRVRDDISFDKVKVRDLIERVATRYYDDDEVGSLVGQENEILRLLFSNGYTEEEIESVRSAFKTKDIFYRREVDQLKRRIMSQKNKGNIYQDYLKEIVTLATKIGRNTETETVQVPHRAEGILFYVNRHE